MMRECGAKEYELTPKKEFRMGAEYTTANNGKVQEMGKRVPVVKFENGSIKKMSFKVGSVNKVLGAVSDICATGNRVIFDDDGSYIQNKKTGEIVPVHKRNKVYVFPIQVVPKSVASQLTSNKQSQPFPRHAERL